MHHSIREWTTIIVHSGLAESEWASKTSYAELQTFNTRKGQMYERCQKREYKVVAVEEESVKAHEQALSKWEWEQTLRGNIVRSS